MTNPNHYFGDPWNPSIAALPRRETPVGQRCLHCMATDGLENFTAVDGADDAKGV